ncbi:MAG: hypothetical protein ACRDQ5_21020 [Sciscionella sp.]
MTLQLTPVQVLAALGGLVVLGFVWRASVHRARRAAEVARQGARFMSLFGRVMCTAALIGGAQWMVLTHPRSALLVAVVLGVPDLLAGYTLTRALTVTTVDVPRSRGGRR